MTVSVMMPAGTYYIGDLCYVLGDRWSEVCEKTISSGHEALAGKFILDDGLEFAMLNTKYGDGRFTSNIIGEEFPVDSGSIGIVDIRFIGKPREEIVNDALGQVVDFDSEFDVADKDGTLCFGEIRIYTNDEEENLDEEYFFLDEEYAYPNDSEDDFDYQYDDEKDH